MGMDIDTETPSNHKLKKTTLSAVETHTNTPNPTSTTKESNQKPPTSTSSISRTPYGNYPAYYTRRTHSHPLSTLHTRLDERLEALSKFSEKLFKGKRILDVGCNTGKVATEIAMVFEDVREVVGLDLDPGLVRRARSYVGYRWSLVEPPASEMIPNESKKRDSCASKVEVVGATTTKEKPRNGVKGGMAGGSHDGDENMERKHDHVKTRLFGRDLDYFPMTCPIMLGTIPVIRHDESNDFRPPPPSLSPSFSSSTSHFPSNISFRCGNFVTEPIPLTDSAKFDTILALSVTKWIHVHHGDSGLVMFFRKLYSSLKKGGCLVLEPQGWGGGGYVRGMQNAKKGAGAGATEEKRTAHGGEECRDCGDDEKDLGLASGGVGELKLRPVDFPEYLVKTVGFKSYELVATSETSHSLKGYKRDIYVFFK
jgi:7SK snRNA methylphosphate capping enzyme